MIVLPDTPPHLDVDLAGLSTAAMPWLAELPVSDQRIQAVPDGRTLRFYQTTGLLDRPMRYDGRVARYGRRHLLQLIAIRVLQSRGLSLAQIQAELSGALDDQLLQLLPSASGPQTTASREHVVAQELAKERIAENTPPAFVAAELVPGMVITIDSRLHTDHARVIALLRRAIKGEET